MWILSQLRCLKSGWCHSSIIILLFQNGFGDSGSFAFPCEFFLLFSCSVVSDSLWTRGLQHTSLPRPSLSSGAYSNSCPSSWWCHPTTSSSVVPFSSCPQSFPASGSFPVSQLFTSSGESIGVCASASVLPMNIQGWFPLGLTGLISLQSKEFLRVFSSATVESMNPSALSFLQSNSHIHTWLLEKP